MLVSLMLLMIIFMCSGTVGSFDLKCFLLYSSISVSRCLYSSGFIAVKRPPLVCLLYDSISFLKCVSVVSRIGFSSFFMLGVSVPCFFASSIILDISVMYSPIFPKKYTM